MRIETKDGLATGLAEQSIARRGRALGVRETQVSAAGPALDELAGRITAEVVDDEQLDRIEILMEAERLQREVDAVVVLVGCHPDGQQGFHARASPAASAAWKPCRN
jgi:hypothetical protein